MRMLSEIALMEADYEKENSELVELFTAVYYWSCIGTLIHGFVILM